MIGIIWYKTQYNSSQRKQNEPQSESEPLSMVFNKNYNVRDVLYIIYQIIEPNIR